MMRARSTVSLLTLVVLFLGGCRSTAPAPTTAAVSDTPRNVILFISDGCGPASFTLARGYKQWKGEGETLTLDRFQTGSVRTRSADSRVTDSAAAATALACGVKTYNGAIGVDTLERPVMSVLEVAESLGKSTGIVTTTSITHATPAAFSAHVPDREMEIEIAEQQIAKEIEVFFGGGRKFYLPSGEGPGIRKDGRNLMREAESAGYAVVQKLEDLRGPLEAPVLGLFADGQLPYEIDRDPDAFPSLSEMTRRAIDLLRDDPDGFFLIVEGGRIDGAGHENDAPTHAHEVLAFDAAVKEAIEFAREDGATLVVSTSDHETGGLTLGRSIDGKGVYAWNPDALNHATSSMEHLTGLFQVNEFPLEDLLARHAGITDLSGAEREWLAPVHEAAKTFSTSEDRDEAADRFQKAYSEIVSRRAIVGWTTNGHTGIDVNLYAFGPGSRLFVGNFDNTHVGRMIASLMGVELRPNPGCCGQ